MPTQAELVDAYKEAAADVNREREAMEWIDFAPDEGLDLLGEDAENRSDGARRTGNYATCSPGVKSSLSQRTNQPAARM
jgi:hypothetical protein